jgi:uncharacterized membrane protein YgcG
MVLVEGEKGDGLTVDHDAFDIASGDAAATASEQVVTAILGTRESAAEGGHRLVATGVAWRDHDEAAALRDALAARHIDDVMLVSELHAAGALAQAVGRAVGYDRTALMFLERDTATLSVVQVSDGSIVKVQTQDLHSADAVAQLAAMVAGLEELDAPPQGVFVVGSGVSVAAIKLQLESATSLPVSAPEEAELALARGAALAGASAPLFEASTVGLAYANADATQVAGAGYMESAAALAYSQVDDAADAPAVAAADDAEEPASSQGRKPFMLVGSALTSIFVVGVAALVISLAVTIRPTVDQRPSPGENVIVPTQVPAAPAPKVPEAAIPPAPVPAPPPETITAPTPVVQQAPAPQAPRTVFVEAPAPAPAAPAPAPAAAPPPPPAAPIPDPPAAPAPFIPPPVAPFIPPPVVAPFIPPPVVAPYIPPPIIVLPKPRLPIFRPPWAPPQNDDNYNPPQQQWPQQRWPQRGNDDYNPPQQQWPQQGPQQWPGRGSGSGSGSGDNGSGDSGSGRGSDGSGSGSGGSPLWPWPSFGGNH